MDFVFASTLAFLVVTGVRLVWAAALTGRAPEFFVGMALLTGAVGGVLETNSIRAVGAGGEPELAFPVQAAARMLYMLGAAILWIGLWRVFHPRRPWARTLAITGFTGSLAVGIAWISLGLHSTVRGADSGSLLFHLARMAPYLWGALISFPYARRLRRRSALGLADPVIAHQVWLCGVAFSASVALVGVILLFHHGLGTSPVESRAGLALLAALGLVAGGTLYAAFFPPPLYRRLVAALAHAAA